MYWANNRSGDRIYIDDSISNEQYFCPHCEGEMTRKLGSVNAHHFAHRPHADCDLWYANHPGKSDWHKSMQELFPQECQEVKICSDADPSIWHIADVFIERPTKNNLIIEFQHSTISWEAFYERTVFYRSNRCNIIDGKKVYNSVVWVFDCLQKKLYIKDIVDEPGCVHVEWPGRDKIRFFGEFSPNYKNVYVVFHAIKNRFEVEVRYSDFGPYDAYVLCFDPNRKKEFINVMYQEDEYRSFDCEEISEDHFVEYATRYL